MIDHVAELPVGTSLCILLYMVVVYAVQYMAVAEQRHERRKGDGKRG